MGLVPNVLSPLPRHLCDDRDTRDVHLGLVEIVVPETHGINGHVLPHILKGIGERLINVQAAADPQSPLSKELTLIDRNTPSRMT